MIHKISSFFIKQMHCTKHDRNILFFIRKAHTNVVQWALIRILTPFSVHFYGKIPIFSKKIKVLHSYKGFLFTSQVSLASIKCDRSFPVNTHFIEERLVLFQILFLLMNGCIFLPFSIYLKGFFNIYVYKFSLKHFDLYDKSILWKLQRHYVLFQWL